MPKNDAETPSPSAPSGCPLHAVAATASADVGPSYRRPFWVGQNRRVRDEIARLDAQRDCQRIVFLLAAYEFPFDTTRALELALFHTYGSRSVSRLLDRTGQFTGHGQKRYDDTNLLIAHFVESGWDGDLGARAIARMNWIHGHYRIPNDDLLFVLWTFIDFPIRWMEAFGWRTFTPHERSAWFNYWIGIGERMGITGLPATREEFDAFVAGYEAREFVFDGASRRTADATVAVMAGWLPRPLRGLVRPVAACLARPQFRRAVGYPDPPPLLEAAIRGALRVRALIKRAVSFERYPDLLIDRRQRSYPGGTPAIEAIGPDVLQRTKRTQTPPQDPR